MITQNSAHWVLQQSCLFEMLMFWNRTLHTLCEKNKIKINMLWINISRLSLNAPCKLCSRCQLGCCILLQSTPPESDTAASECRLWSACADDDKQDLHKEESTADTDMRHEYPWRYQHLNQSIQLRVGRIFVLGWTNRTITLTLTWAVSGVNAWKTPHSPPSRHCPGQRFSLGSYQRLADPGGHLAGFLLQS